MIVLSFCLVFRRIVCTVLPVSQDCPFLMAPSVSSNVHFQRSRINGNI